MGARLELVAEEELCEPLGEERRHGQRESRSALQTSAPLEILMDPNRIGVTLLVLPLSPVDVLGVARESVEQQEDVSAARDPVTNPRAFLQQTFLPNQFRAADTCVKVLGFLVDQVSLSKQIGHACILRQEMTSMTLINGGKTSQ